MKPQIKGREFPKYAAVCAATALFLTGCQPGNATNPATPTEGGTATGAATEIPHHKDGGLTMADSLPHGDSHPVDMTPQQLYAIGERSVFSIEGRRPDDFTGFGTGFLVDKEGGMGITNAHVVEGLTAITGRFNNGDKVALHVIGSDPCSDVAVVHFSSPLPDKAEALIVGNSADVKPGDTVTVLGYPSSVTPSSSEQRLLITSGLVNASKVPARPPGLPEYKETIQHGAAVNDGNSGGPLLDHHGRLVGINTMINFGPRAAPPQGQHYSIAIDSAKREIVDRLLKRESPNNMGWSVEEYYPGYFTALDANKGPALDQQMAGAGIKGGLYVKAVTPGAGASNVGIAAGMMLTKLQNTSTNTVAEMCAISESILPGSTADVEGVYLLFDTERFTARFKVQFTVPGKH
jgi:S1-C subfamily serine protease